MIIIYFFVIWCWPDLKIEGRVVRQAENHRIFLSGLRNVSGKCQVWFVNRQKKKQLNDKPEPEVDCRVDSRVGMSGNQGNTLRDSVANEIIR